MSCHVHVLLNSFNEMTKREKRAMHFCKGLINSIIQNYKRYMINIITMALKYFEILSLIRKR